MSFTVGVIIMSDRAFDGRREDGCIPVFEELLGGPDFEIAATTIVNDDSELIDKALGSYIADGHNLIFTSGGTGCGLRDNTPEVTARLIDRPTPGIDEAIRRFSESKSMFAIYSRSVSGFAVNSLVINLPGSPRAVREVLEFLLPKVDLYGLYSNLIVAFHPY
jgi:molybdopterin adenylyltransferase